MPSPDRTAASTGLGGVSMHRHAEAARVTIAGARLHKRLIVVTPSEYEALIDIAFDASHHTEDDRMQTAITRWKDNHVID